VTAGPARGRTQPLGSASGFGRQLHEENRRHLVGAGREGSSRPALRAVTAARSDVHRAFRRIHRPSVRVRGDLNSRLRENTDGHARASDLAIDLPHRVAGRARTASGYTRIPRRQHHGSHHGRPCRQFTHARLTQRPRRGVSAPGGALTPSLRLTGRTGP